MKLHVCLAVLMSMFATLATAAAAQATSPTPASGTTWSPNQLVEYRWKEGGQPPAWMRDAVNAAAADSNTSRESRAAVLGYASDGTSWISYTDDLPTNWAIGYTTRNVPTSFTIRLRPQGYALDWGTLRWCQFYGSPPNGCYDAEMITLHEFGHAQTLGHADEADVTSWTDTIMHEAPKTKAKAGWSAHAYGRCDVARLQIRYQPKRSTTPYSTCLDLPTSLSLSSSAASVVIGGNVTLTATLNVADSATYASLAGNALDGRHVTLQRRVPGGSWSSTGSMDSLSDGSGRYRLTVSVSSTYDWRAVFNSPPDEGLEGSTSPTVRVSVASGCFSAGLDGKQPPTYPIC